MQSSQSLVGDPLKSVGVPIDPLKSVGVPIDPSKWGRSTWDTLHWIAAGYPDTPTVEQQLSATRVFGSLGLILPCPTCSQHYNELISEMPVTDYVQSGHKLREWVVMMHNKVNYLTGKPEVWTVEQANQKYREMPARPTRSAVSTRSASISASTQPDAFGSVSGRVVSDRPVSKAVAARRLQRRIPVQASTEASVQAPVQPTNKVQRAIQSRQLSKALTPKTLQVPKKKGCSCRK